MTDKLIIFDTTLRDGEQSPGASMTRDEKLRIARQLERLKVDVIEAGFAASSNGDFEAVQAIANAIKDSTICSLSRANDRDIAGRPRRSRAPTRARIHTFIATSPLHMEKKLRMTPEQVFEQARQSVRFARNLCADVEFSPGRWLPQRHGLPVPRARGRDRRRGHHHQRARHRGLCIPELYGNFIKTCASACPTATRRSGRCIATTTWAWRWPTRWPASRSAARARSSARSTAWASARATARWKRS
jgi:2-isopropylmalate synthase